MPRPIGYKCSPETRAKMSAAVKRTYADPEKRAKMVAHNRRTQADPAVRAKISAANKRAWANPSKGRKYLRDLTPEQRAAYRLYRRKKLSMAEALALVAQAAPA